MYTLLVLLPKSVVLPLRCWGLVFVVVSFLTPEEKEYGIDADAGRGGSDERCLAPEPSAVVGRKSRLIVCSFSSNTYSRLSLFSLES